MPREENWKIDKHIPVAVIITIILQTFGVIWWAARIDSRVAAIEQLNLEERTQVIEKDIPVIREKINNIEKSTDRIEKKIDKLSLNWPHRKATVFNDNDLIQLSLAELMEIKTS